MCVSPHLKRVNYLSIHLVLELLEHGAASEDFQTALSCKSKTQIENDLHKQQEICRKIYSLTCGFIIASFTV
jgi:hypothetical protein